MGRRVAAIDWAVFGQLSNSRVDFIGPYRLLKLIRAGHATHIWEAMDSLDHERVALKSLQSDYHSDKHEIAILRHEFSVGSTLDHPNVNPVKKFDTARNVPFVVMDYFPGLNLKQAIRQIADQVDECLTEIILQAGAGLEHLHERGWIHRDVKPDNFLMNEAGEVRLIDFAIGQKIKKKSGFGSLFAGKAPIMGTRSYMSPEQIRGEFIDQRADVYSFACVMFELAVGRPPFTGNTADDLLRKHLRNSPPAIASFNSKITPDFSKLVTKMMSKKPEKRPETMAEVLDAIKKMRVKIASKPS